jgi:hypothetical protein
MIRFPKPLVLAALVLAGAPAPLRAQTVCPPLKAVDSANPQQQEIYARRRAEIARLDRDCDGSVSRQEWQQYFEARFAAADLDHDGRISPDEQKAMVARYDAHTEEHFGAVIIRHAGELGGALRDINGGQGGAIAKERYMAYYLSRFEGMDENHDGMLTVNEFQTDFEGVTHRR